MDNNANNSGMNDEEGFTTNDEEPDDIDFPELTSEFDFSSVLCSPPVTGESQTTLNLVTPFYSNEYNQHPFSYANLPKPSCSNWTSPVTKPSPVKENSSCIPQSDSFDYNDDCNHDDLSCTCSNVLAVNSEDLDIKQNAVDGTNNQNTFKKSHGKIRINIKVAQDMISTKESQPSTSIGESSSKENLKRDLQFTDSHSVTSKKRKGLEPRDSKYKSRSKTATFLLDEPSDKEGSKIWERSVNAEKGRRKKKDYIDILNEENGTLRDEINKVKEKFEMLDEENKRKFEKLDGENRQLKSEIDQKNIQLDHYKRQTESLLKDKESLLKDKEIFQKLLMREINNS